MDDDIRSSSEMTTTALVMYFSVVTSRAYCVLSFRHHGVDSNPYLGHSRKTILSFRACCGIDAWLVVYGSGRSSLVEGVDLGNAGRYGWAVKRPLLRAGLRHGC